MTDISYRAAKNRAKRKAKVKASFDEYEKHKEEILAYKKAVFIIEYMKRVCWKAEYLMVDNILSKVHTKEELEFYYRWCCCEKLL